VLLSSLVISLSLSLSLSRHLTHNSTKAAQLQQPLLGVSYSVLLRRTAAPSFPELQAEDSAQHSRTSTTGGGGAAADFGLGQDGDSSSDSSTDSAPSADAVDNPDLDFGRHRAVLPFPGSLVSIIKYGQPVPVVVVVRLLCWAVLSRCGLLCYAVL
jgi:hypothetical protein